MVKINARNHQNEIEQIIKSGFKILLSSLNFISELWHGKDQFERFEFSSEHFVIYNFPYSQIQLSVLYAEN